MPFEAITRDGWQLGWQRRRHHVSDDGMPYIEREWKAAQITPEMVEAGARALYDRHLKTTTYFRDFEEMRELFEGEARTVLDAALASRDSQPTREGS